MAAFPAAVIRWDSPENDAAPIDSRKDTILPNLDGSGISAAGEKPNEGTGLFDDCNKALEEPAKEKNREMFR